MFTYKNLSLILKFLCFTVNDVTPYTRDPAVKGESTGDLKLRTQYVYMV